MNVSEKATPQLATRRHARHGLVLAPSTLKALQKRGIYCTTGVSLEHQHLARRYVLRGVESGGAVSDMGRACAFRRGGRVAIGLATAHPLDWREWPSCHLAGGKHGAH